MADVKIAVGLWREAGHHRLVAPGRQIGLDDVADEVLPRFANRCVDCRHCC
jgi:hypothetical protein